MRQSQINPKRSNVGFTLIELLVAIALFTTLIAVAVGGFTNALHTQRQISSLIAADSNVSLAIEQMAREIRTGSDFCPLGSGGNPLCEQTGSDSFTSAPVYDNLAFLNALGQTVVYKLQNGVLEKSIDGGDTFAPVTGSNTTVDYFMTTLSGNTVGDHWNPRVTFSIGVSPKDPTLASEVLNLQTTVSVRAIDCDASGNC
jgi:prepilin-type N-terminal cleavage/methylation domain-containing protein